MSSILRQAIEALWVLTEHNALHFGENHNTVIQGKATLASLRAAQEGDLPPLLTDEWIAACIDEANRNFNGRKQGPSGQQMTTYDDWKYWLARTIESEVRLALAAAGGGVPQGWKLVPVEPTIDMLDAGDAAFTLWDKWAAMLASSPKPEAAPAVAQADPLEKLTRLQEEMGLYNETPAQAGCDCQSPSACRAYGRCLKLSQAAPSAGEVEREVWLRELLRRSRPYVLEASSRYYDGTDGASIRQNAHALRIAIDAALSHKEPQR